MSMKLRSPWSARKWERIAESKARRNALAVYAALRGAGGVRCYRCGVWFASDRELVWHRVPRRLEADSDRGVSLLLAGACFPADVLRWLGLRPELVQGVESWRFLDGDEFAAFAADLWDSNPWSRCRFYLGPLKALDRP